MLGLLTLFTSGFLAATLLPVGSEPVLVAYLLNASSPDWWPTVIVAILVMGAGNTLGGMVTYAMGRGVRILWNSRNRTEPVTPEQRRRSTRWLDRWGPWGLLLAWVPVVGDPLCLVAGAMRLPVLTSFLAMALGKLARYVVVASVVLQI